jgi:hypothetical protein
MYNDLSDLTVEEMLYLKDELNEAYEELIKKQNEWLEMCNGLRNEMYARSADLKAEEEKAKKAREADYDYLYEANNNLH